MTSLSEPIQGTTTTRERLDTIGWGIVFLLVGTVALPGGPAQYAAVAVVGALLLGLSLALARLERSLNLFTTVLGATALASGLAALGGLKVDAFALFFILLGLVMVAVPLIRLAGRRA